MKKLIVIMFVSAIAGLTACNNEEIGKAKDVNPETIYFDYRISGDEATGRTTVRLQYRFAGSGGTTLVLEDPSRVTLDGKMLNVDSSRFNGAYYEADIATDSFAGKHEIVFTGPAGKKYTEQFTYTPFQLGLLPDSLSAGKDLVLEIGGLEEGERLHLMMTDTTFRGNGIERIEKVKQGRIVVPAEELTVLKKGPVYLDLSTDIKRNLKDTTPEGGALYLNYRLKREFLLR